MLRHTMSQWAVFMGATSRGAEQYRLAMRAAWAISYGQPMPQPPVNVSLSRWQAMIKHVQQNIK
jgi:hypothetical protein